MQKLQLQLITFRAGGWGCVRGRVMEGTEAVGIGVEVGEVVVVVGVGWCRAGSSTS